VLLGTALGRPIAAVMTALRTPPRDPLAAYHLGFVALNVALLAASAVLLHAVLDSAGVAPVLALGLVPFLAANDVVKAFMWTAHQQILNVAAPLALLAAAQAQALRDPRRGDLALGGLVAGVLFVTYGSLVLLAPLLAIAACWRRARDGALSAAWAARAGLSVLAATAVVPLAWIGFVTWRNGAFYAHETARYRQFVWIADAARVGPEALLDRAAVATVAFARTFRGDAAPVLVAAVLVAVAARVAARGAAPAPEATQATRAMLAATLGLTVPFLWALGFYAPRLTFALVPLLLVAVALGLQQLCRRRGWRPGRAALACGIAGAAWHVAHFVTLGPYD
jgi:hypothetical protein